MLTKYSFENYCLFIHSKFEHFNSMVNHFGWVWVHVGLGLINFYAFTFYINLSDDFLLLLLKYYRCASYFPATHSSMHVEVTTVYVWNVSLRYWNVVHCMCSVYILNDVYLFEWTIQRYSPTPTFLFPSLSFICKAKVTVKHFKNAHLIYITVSPHRPNTNDNDDH